MTRKEIIKSICGKYKANPLTCLKVQGHIFEEPSDMVDILAKHYENISSSSNLFHISWNKDGNGAATQVWNSKIARI